jgi:hypothetical protein
MVATLAGTTGTVQRDTITGDPIPYFPTTLPDGFTRRSVDELYAPAPEWREKDGWLVEFRADRTHKIYGGFFRATVRWSYMTVDGPRWTWRITEDGVTVAAGWCVPGPMALGLADFALNRMCGRYIGLPSATPDGWPSAGPYGDGDRDSLYRPLEGGPVSVFFSRPAMGRCAWRFESTGRGLTGCAVKTTDAMAIASEAVRLLGVPGCSPREAA